MRRASVLVIALSLLTGCGVDATSDLAGDVATPSGVPWSPQGPPTAPAAEGGTSRPTTDTAEAPEQPSEQALATGPAEPEPQQTSTGAPPTGERSEPDPHTDEPEVATSTAASPRAAGTYRYDTDGYMEATGGDRRSLPDVTTLTVGDANASGQHDVRDVRDEDGRGRVTENTLVYRDDGVYLSRVKVTTDVGGGVRDVREWALDPPELLVSTGAEPGYQRTFAMRNVDTTAQVTVELTGRETLTVDGQRVDTVVTRIHIVLSGSVEGTQTTTAWSRPADLLTVQEHVQSDARNGPLRVRFDYRATLQTLEPSP